MKTARQRGIPAHSGTAGRRPNNRTVAPAAPSARARSAPPPARARAGGRRRSREDDELAHAKATTTPIPPLPKRSWKRGMRRKLRAVPTATLAIFAMANPVPRPRRR